MEMSSISVSMTSKCKDICIVANIMSTHRPPHTLRFLAIDMYVRMHIDIHQSIYRYACQTIYLYACPTKLYIFRNIQKLCIYLV